MSSEPDHEWSGGIWVEGYALRKIEISQHNLVDATSREILPLGFPNEGCPSPHVWELTAIQSHLYKLHYMKFGKRIALIAPSLFALILSACGVSGGVTRNSEDTGDVTTYQIVTLLPADAIPSIDNPRFYSIAEADLEYSPDELVIGVDFDGDARAYSIEVLSSREIVNDVVNGKPIAVTW